MKITNNMETKKTEILKTIDSIDELVTHRGWFLAKSATRSYKKQIMNAETGEIEEIERNEILFEKGTIIDGDFYAKLNFAFQTGDLHRIIISNQHREAEETYKGISVYFALVEIQLNRKVRKARLLFFADSIPVATEILKDYIELNYSGKYRIVSIKEYNTDLLLQNETEDPEKEYIFYNIIASAVDKDNAEVLYQNMNAVIKAVDIDNALEMLKKWAIDFLKDWETDFVIKLQEAKIITANGLIPKEFSLAYNSN